MCWNAEVSIQSFAIGLLGIFLAAMTGTSALTIFFYATIVFMQLVEYIVWTYGSDPEINFYASLGGAGLLMLQPIAVETRASPKQPKAASRQSRFHPSTDIVDRRSCNRADLSFY